MSDIQRWTIAGTRTFFEDASGDLVKYDDHIAMQNQIKAEAIEEYAKWLDSQPPNEKCSCLTCAYKYANKLRGEG